MLLVSGFRCAAVTLLIALPFTAMGAIISGTVKEASGNPIENARIDHTGKQVVLGAPGRSGKPSGDEIRTDSKGHFRVVINVPAIVIRKPGYVSQRVRVTGDAELQITLDGI